MAHTQAQEEDKARFMASLARDLDFMRRPGDWPRWPVLPLKLRSGDSHSPDWAAFMFADGKPVAYVGVIWGHDDCKLWSEVMDKCQARVFGSLEQLAAIYTVD